ncbi:MAG: hypothetical protein NXI15_00115 [Gammaproteobacteria bacterium]|jgi:hypothetical protein|nr:hypothetical protein [Gammaproteobacteria bacterium]
MTLNKVLITVIGLVVVLLLTWQARVNAAAISPTPLAALPQWELAMEPVGRNMPLTLVPAKGSS